MIARDRDAALLRELRRKEGSHFARRVWVEVKYERAKAALLQRLQAKRKP